MRKKLWIIHITAWNNFSCGIYGEGRELLMLFTVFKKKKMAMREREWPKALLHSRYRQVTENEINVNKNAN